jgi:hypothetical protein
MYCCYGEKEKGMEILAKVDCLHEVQEAKEAPMPKPLLQPST